MRLATQPPSRPSGDLRDHIRRQYADLPGLKLTLPQAQRLWHTDRRVCEAALDALVAEGFLVCRHDRTYVCLEVRRRPAKARLPSS